MYMDSELFPLVPVVTPYLLQVRNIADDKYGG